MTAASEDLATPVLRALARGETVDRELPAGGHLHLERMLPWLALYRRPPADEHTAGADRPVDQGTGRLVRSEAAWLVAEAEDEPAPLVERLAGGLARGGPFLLVELWSRRRSPRTRPGSEAPRFRVLAGGDEPLARAAGAVAARLAPVERATGERAWVEVVRSHRPAPPGRHPVAAPGGSIRLLGIEVEPVYREHLEPEPGGPGTERIERLYPLVLADLRRELSRALRHGAAVFLERSAAHAICPLSDLPDDAEATELPRLPAADWARRLGPARLDGETRASDARLARIDRSIDFLVLVTPTNTRDAWREFESSGFARAPRLLYRPLPFDPPALKRELFEARVEEIDDPALGHLLREKQEEIDRKITMLRDRGTERFLSGSLQVYGGAEPELVELAEKLLYRLGTHRPAEPVEGSLDAAAFARRAESELDWYRRHDRRLTARVEIRRDLPPSLMVTGDTLTVGAGISIPAGRVDALLQHEVGTHLVTQFNGSRQPLALLATGLAGYDVLQEGLAVAAEYLAGGLAPSRLRTLAARVIAVESLVEGEPFEATFAELVDRYGFTPESAWSVVVRVYRSGGLTKDAVYLRGLVRLLEHLGAGGRLEPLLVGKLDLPHEPEIEELLDRGVLVPPALLPRWLVRSEDRARLLRLEAGLTPLDLVAA